MRCTNASLAGWSTGRVRTRTRHAGRLLGVGAQARYALIEMRWMTVFPKDESFKADWPQISQIIPNHNGNCPPATDEFDGREVCLGGEVGAKVRFGPRNCRWCEAGEELELEYEAFALGEQLFLIDAMPVLPDARSLTVIFDLAQRRALVIEVTFPHPCEAQTGVLARLASTGSQSAVSVRYRQAPIGENEAVPFRTSRALVGKQFRYTYSETHIYDHYYLSDRFYSWFCREGPDKGLGDFEECDYFELGPRMFLVSWREKLLPCVGILVEDHSAMRATGKICGADAYTGVVGNTRVGCSIRLVADTSNA